MEWQLIASRSVDNDRPTKVGGWSICYPTLTELPDGTLAALLGASPGASVSANIALEIIQRCFPEKLRAPDGYARMKAMLPTFDLDQSAIADDHARRSAEIDDLLELKPGTARRSAGEG